MCDLQLADECECHYLLTTVEDIGELVLEEIDIGFETVSRSHLNREEVVTTLSFLASGVLCEEVSVTSEKLWRERSCRE